MSDNFSLADRTVLITGSSAGLGKAMAHSFGAAGARVAINYQNNVERAEETFSGFRDAGFEGALFRGDVTDEAEVHRLTAEIAETLGPIDIVVVNATPAQPQKPIEEYDWEFYQSMIDFFIKSPFLLARATIPHMRTQKWGRIINIASEVFTRGLSPFSAYVAAKGGQLGWTRSMANELAPDGITVNAISPGWIPVERHDNDSEEDKQGYLDVIPMQRWGVPSDVGIAQNMWPVGEVSEAREWFCTVRVWLPTHLITAVLETDVAGRTRSWRVFRKDLCKDLCRIGILVTGSCFQGSPGAQKTIGMLHRTVSNRRIYPVPATSIGPASGVDR